MNFAKALDFFDIALLQFQAANLIEFEFTCQEKIIGFNFTSVSMDLFCINEYEFFGLSTQEEMYF